MTTIVRPGRRGVRDRERREEQWVAGYPYRTLWHCRECGCRFRVVEGDPITYTIAPRAPDRWAIDCPNPECVARVRLEYPLPIGCVIALVVVILCVGIVIVLGLTL